MNIPAVCIAMLYMGIYAHAQPCNIIVRGQIEDADDSTPLAFATVYFEELGSGVVADEQGHFSIDSVCNGVYKVVCSHVGCSDLRFVLNIQRDTTVKIEMNHSSEVLNQLVVVTTVTHPHKPLVASNTILDEAAVNRLKGGILGDMLKDVTGITTVNTGATISKPMLHGLTGNRLLIVNNGVRQEGQQWGSEHAPEIDPLSVGAVSVIKGAMGVVYGSDAMAGVLVINAPKLPTERKLGGEIMGVGHTNALGGGLSVALGSRLGNSDWAWRAHGAYKRYADASAPHYNLSNTGMAERSATVQLGTTSFERNISLLYSYFQTNVGILQAAHIGNLTDLERAIASDTPLIVLPKTWLVGNPQQTVQHHLLKGETTLHIGNQLHLNSKLAFQNDHRREYDLRRGGRDSIPALDLVQYTSSADVSITKDIKGTEGWSYVLGTAAMYQTNFSQAGTGVRPLIPNYIALHTGGYAMLRHLGRRVHLEAGTRYEFRFMRVSRFDATGNIVRPVFDFHNIDATLGTRWKSVNEHWAWIQTAGTAFRAPNVSELFSNGVHHGIAAYEIGNDQLKPERAIKYLSDVRYSNATLNIQVSPYIQYIRNFIYLHPDSLPVLTIRGAFPSFSYRSTNALLLGTDCTAQVQLAKQWRATSKIALLRARDLRQTDFLYNMPPTQLEQSITYTQETLKRCSNLSATITTKYVPTQKAVPTPYTDFAPPPKGYALLNAEIQLTLPNQQTTLYLGATNILNTTYRDYMNRFRYYADEKGADLFIKIHHTFFPSPNNQ